VRGNLEIFALLLRSESEKDIGRSPALLNTTLKNSRTKLNLISLPLNTSV
jgi:hypothetical protein